MEDVLVAINFLRLRAHGGWLLRSRLCFSMAMVTPRRSPTLGQPRDKGCSHGHCSWPGNRHSFGEGALGAPVSRPGVLDPGLLQHQAWSPLHPVCGHGAAPLAVQVCRGVGALHRHRQLSWSESSLSLTPSEHTHLLTVKPQYSSHTCSGGLGIFCGAYHTHMWTDGREEGSRFSPV